jgi:rfaE bifunctional protein nucleotidyltransferase chain/domain
MSPSEAAAIPLDIARTPQRARDKIKSLHELAAITAALKARGKSVVLAHGVFDLVHMGHVRHLEAAAAEGDVLIVTITPDEFVNKGPGRPVFTASLRAEMLAALGCTGWVGINEWPSAEQLLDLIKPNVYVKGSDYSNEEEDLTGKIRMEREAVERHGGRVVYTDDITFSSSSLINRHLNVFEPEVMEYLGGLDKETHLARALGALDRIKDMRVLLVGEAIIDEYLYAKPMGKSAKENIIASRYSGREVFAGGVIAAANHVADFVKDVEVVTILGERDSYQNLIRDTIRDNVTVHSLYRPGLPTIRKSRYVDPGHMRKLFEVYHFDDTPLNGVLEKQLCDMIGDRARDFDVVIVTDFGHGMMTPKAIRTTMDASPFLAVNAQSNSANHGYNMITRYNRADYVCIDAPEAQLATGDRFSDIEDVISGGLAHAIDCDRFVVTHGQNGCVTYKRNHGPRRVPAFTRQVVDTVGAGDAFLAVTSPVVAGGADMETAGFIGNAVGALKVGIVGHRQSVEKIPVQKYITTLLK